MQSFLVKIFGTVVGFLSFGNIKKILLQLRAYWNNVDITGKLIMLLLFAPSVIVLFWMLGYIAYIVVFTLPGIVMTIIAQVFLFGIFWAGAVYIYEKMNGTVAEKVVIEPEMDADKKSGRGSSANWRKKV